MLRSLRHYSAILLLLTLVSSENRLLAVSSPSTLSLSPRYNQVVDPELAHWFKTYAENESPVDLTRDELMGLLKTLTPIEQVAVKLYIVSQNDAKKKLTENFDLDRTKLLEEALNLMTTEFDKSSSDQNVILSDVALLYTDISPKGIGNDVVKKIFDKAPVYACSAKNRLMDSMKRIKQDSLTDSDIQSAIQASKEYESLSHRRRLLDVIATNLPDDRRKNFIAAIRDAGGMLPLLMRRHAWLQNDDVDLPQDSWIQVTKAIRRKDCIGAQSNYEIALKDRSPTLTLEQAVSVGTNVEQCFKAKGRQHAIAFWEKVTPRMKERFGEQGVHWANVRIGYQYWAKDQYDQARTIYSSILDKSNKNSNQSNLTAKAMFTLGRIAENQNDFDKAISYFSDYVSKYTSNEDFETALNSLVVARGARGQWKEMAVDLKRYVDQQALVSIDQRPVGNMAFSLFWLGRAYLNLSQLELAKEMWRRLASEYYSTFYGALGHFLLERSSGRTFALEPSRVRGFKFEPFVASLSPKQKDVTVRTLALLKIGLFDVARCEVDELNTSEKSSHDVQLVRSLLLHASGAWLDAIKIYDALPRTVRNSLPVGFERILFPRKYSELVNHYSQKLGLDADLVFAVMRQESVFHKEAMSPVGAMGLMQLMPATASIELKKLPGGYVNSERKSELGTLLHNEVNLLDPDVNVTLGVHHLSRLLQIYKSPVFALTSYNASPAATLKWKRTIASDDLLIFIERIPYKETRNYVKLIMRNYFYYKRWYGSSSGTEVKHLETIAEDLLAQAKKAQSDKASAL